MSAGRRSRLAARGAVALSVALLLGAASAFAQVPQSSADREVETTLDATLLRDLPTGDNLLALLETTQPSLVSDRFSSGGLYAGQAARIGGFSGSWTQTLFRLGDVTLSDPTGSGTPLLFPDPGLWQRVRMTSGSMPLDINAAGLAVTLEPLAPTSTWMRTIGVSTSHGALSGGARPAVAPAIDRLDAWDRASAAATGPLTPHLGGAFAASWTRGSQFARSEPAAVEGRSASAYAHLVFTRSGGGQLSALGWVQRSSYPFPLRRAFATPAVSTGDDGVHAQVASTSTLGRSWSVRSFAAYTQRSRDTSGLGSTARPLWPVRSPTHSSGNGRLGRGCCHPARPAPSALPAPPGLACTLLMPDSI